MIYHNPVMLTESIDGLNIKNDGIYIDLTFGGGGHSREILKSLGEGQNSEAGSRKPDMSVVINERHKCGRLIAFDQDIDAIKNYELGIRNNEFKKQFEDKEFMLLHSNFKYLKNFLDYYGIKKVDGILADLGVSSHHFDEGDRGFSIRFEGELDMRMNKNTGITAKDILNKYEENELTRIFYDYGELSNAKEISKAIINNRKIKQIGTTEELKRVVLERFFANAQNDKSKAALVANERQQLTNERQQKGNSLYEIKFLAKVFQSLRIEVNNEIEALKEMLLQTPGLLERNGRVVIIAYHSLEDKLVKNFFKTGNFEGVVDKDFYGNVNRAFKILNKKAIVPSAEELKINNRARSAKLRIAEKL